MMTNHKLMVIGVALGVSDLTAGRPTKSRWWANGRTRMIVTAMVAPAVSRAAAVHRRAMSNTGPRDSKDKRRLLSWATEGLYGAFAALARLGRPREAEVLGTTGMSAGTDGPGEFVQI